MAEPELPMTQTMKASEAKQQWASLLDQVFKREKRVLVEKSGIPVAAVVSAQDLERLQRLDAQDAEDFRILQDSRAAFQDVPDEELEREVSRAVEQARERYRQASSAKRRARTS